MRKSASVPATLIIAISASLLTGCSRPREVRRCLDDRGQVLPDHVCEQPGRYRSGMGGLIFLGTPRFGYGGSMMGGNRMSGFSRMPTGNADIVTPSGRTISRGGFGSTGRSSGGFFS